MTRHDWVCTISPQWLKHSGRGHALKLTLMPTVEFSRSFRTRKKRPTSHCAKGNLYSAANRKRKILCCPLNRNLLLSRDLILIALQFTSFIFSSFLSPRVQNICHNSLYFTSQLRNCRNGIIFQWLLTVISNFLFKKFWWQFDCPWRFYRRKHRCWNSKFL